MAITRDPMFVVDPLPAPVPPLPVVDPPLPVPLLPVDDPPEVLVEVGGGREVGREESEEEVESEVDVLANDKTPLELLRLEESSTMSAKLIKVFVGLIV